MRYEFGPSFSTIDAALVRTADRRDTDLHPGLVPGTYLDRSSAPGRHCCRTFGSSKSSHTRSRGAEKRVCPLICICAKLLVWRGQTASFPSWYDDVGNSLGAQHALARAQFSTVVPHFHDNRTNLHWGPGESAGPRRREGWPSMVTATPAHRPRSYRGAYRARAEEARCPDD